MSEWYPGKILDGVKERLLGQGALPPPPVEAVRRSRYTMLEHMSVGRPYYDTLERIEAAKTYEEVENVVRSYMSILKEFIEDVRRMFPEYSDEAERTARLWYSGAVWEALNKIRKIAEGRLEWR